MAATLLLAGLVWLGGQAGAHEVNPRLATLPGNTALDLGRYPCRQPEDDPFECDNITDYSRLTYDRHGHQILMFGGGHAATHRTDVDVFSFKTLTWSSAYSSTPCSQMRLSNRGLERSDWLTTGHPIARHTYDMLVMADRTRQLLLLGTTTGQGHCVEKRADKDAYFLPGKIAAYDPLTKRWAFAPARNDLWRPYASAEYEPQSGLVVIMDYNGLWTYDPVSHTVNQRLEFPGELGRDLGWGKNLVYFPPTERMYYFANGNAVFEVSIERSGRTAKVVRLSGVTGDVPELRETGFAYDAANRLIGGAVGDGVFYAFDPVSRRWAARVMETLPPGRKVGTVAFHALDYDPVDNVFIFITDYESGRHTWAYRYGVGTGAAVRPDRSDRR